MLIMACLAAFLGLMILAGFEDVRARRIPNWLTGSVAGLYPVYVLAAPAPVAWAGALAAALVVFLLGWLLFARGIMGGGDVKLITAATLWAGVEHLVLLAVVTSLTGGVLAIASVLREHWGWRLMAPFLAFASATVAGFGRANRRPPETAKAPPAETDVTPPTLPYGIAVAAGGLAVALQLMHS